ncbi:MAG: ChbG/HpnK family deacetylase [Anaerolineales bacterium]|nr:ChbG/HpnK family deacetylase [Anaerolineales bacterium]
MAKFLIVNADDYGLHPSVSAGIRKAHLEGILTSTTTMMNMPDAELALRIAAEHCPNLGLGVHLTLTAGSPLLPPEQLPALMNLSDGIRFPRESVLREGAKSIPAAEVKAEWRAQIERFISLSGKQPDHLDSHHNSSYFTYPFFEAMLELAAEYDCAVRLCYSDAEQGDYTALPSDFPADATPHELTRRFNVPAPDSFIGGFYGENVSLEYLISNLQSLSDGVTELMTHPALDGEALKGISSYNLRRGDELGALIHPQAMETVKANQIELVSFGKLI